MNKILVRLYIVKESKAIEAYFDSRLSFTDNLHLLGYNKEPLIYDFHKGLFLKNDVPISAFRLNRFMAFDIY